MCPMCLVCVGCPARGGRALQTYVSDVFGVYGGGWLARPAGASQTYVSDVFGVYGGWLSAGVPAMRERRGEGCRPSPSQAWAPQAWAPQAWQAGLHLEYGF